METHRQAHDGRGYMHLFLVKRDIEAVKINLPKEGLLQANLLDIVDTLKELLRCLGAVLHFKKRRDRAKVKLAAAQ